MTTSRPSHVPADRVVDIDIYALPGQSDDFHQAWKALQDSAPPLAWTPRNEGHWIALRGDILAEVQSDHARFSNRVIVLPRSVGEKHGLIPTTIDPPQHRPYRKLLNDGMALARVRRLHDTIRTTARALIDGFAVRGRCDFTGEFAEVLPIRIFMALVGLPMSDAGQIRHWAACMTRPNPPMPFEAARQAFFDYLDPIITMRLAT
ncbi:MAG TPA: cytochrome P450, partial [Novosphingobium sp.]